MKRPRLYSALLATMLAVCALAQETKPADPAVDEESGRNAGEESGSTERATPPAPAPAPAPAAAETPATDDAGRDLVKRASEAIKRAKSITFKARVTQSGMMAGKLPNLEAEVKVLRLDGSTGAGQWRCRATGSGTRKTEEGNITFDVSWDRAGYRTLDIAAKKLIERPSSATKPAAVLIAAAAVPTQFQEPNPIMREMQSASATIIGREVVDGVDCDVIELRHKTVRSTTKYWLGVDDHFPRKIDRRSETPGYENGTLTEFANLQVDPPLSDADLQIALPAGFELDSQAPPPPVKPATSPSAPPDPATGETASPSAPVDTRQSAPDFELSGPAGKIKLSQLKGQTVVLYFWGTWSLSSRVAEEHVQALHDVFKDRNVKVLALSVREKSDTAPIEALAAGKRTFAALLGADSVARLFGVSTYPTFVVIDSEGKIDARFDGFRRDHTPDDLLKAVEAAAARKPPTNP